MMIQFVSHTKMVNPSVCVALYIIASLSVPFSLAQNGTTSTASGGYFVEVEMPGWEGNFDGNYFRGNPNPDITSWRYDDANDQCKLIFRLSSNRNNRDEVWHYTMPNGDKVSAGGAQDILAMHNEYRKNVQPTARNMMLMYYSDHLAARAQTYINTCPPTHNTYAQRRTNSNIGINVGQNLAWDYGDWQTTVDGWFSDGEDFIFGIGANGPGGVVGHYTQLIRDKATHVGCGFKMCESGTHFVCDYAYAQINFDYPYQGGPSCGDCPDHCVDNMCDCGPDKLCHNLGVLDPSTCKCACVNPFVGENCDRSDCAFPDPPYCSVEGGYRKDMCDKFENVPYECPHMCGTCADMILRGLDGEEMEELINDVNIASHGQTKKKK